MPLYCMFMFRAPASTIQRLEKIRRDFLWDDFDGSPKFQLMNWKKVCRSLDKGGLGVQSLNLMNRALLGKWLWRFDEERDALWRCLISVKYGEDPLGWMSNNPTGPYGCSVWRGICMEQEFFSQAISFSVQRGTRVKFSHDVWCRNESLKSRFPNIYNLTNLKEGMVRQHMEEQARYTGWDLKLRRNLNEWEIEEMASLLYKLEKVKLGSETEEDRRVWSKSLKGVFSVCSYYKSLEEDSPQFTLWRFLWRSPVPTKVSFFVWLAYWEKILPVDKLIARGFFHPNRCVMCYKDAESANRLLVHCPVASMIWNFFLNQFGLCWVMQENLKQVLQDWKGCNLKALSMRRRVLWKCIPFAICWVIWRERIDRIF